MEQAVESLDGAVELVKADTDQAPKSAGEFGVQGIPAVYAVAHGKVIDQFTGVMPESAIDEWLGRNLQSFSLGAAERMLADDPAEAKVRFEKVLEENPRESRAEIGLATIHFNAGDFDLASERIEQLEARGFLEAEAESLKVKIRLATSKGAGIEELQASVEQDPNDHEARFALSSGLAVDGQFEQALQQLLMIVQKDRGEYRERAREEMVELFRVVDDEALVRTYRKKLSMELY